jgi:5-methylcytosine-specific restriction endonuclease McrA
MLLKCSGCKKTKNSKYFYKDHSKKTGYHTRCKECFMKSIQEYRKTSGYLESRRKYGKTPRAIAYRKKYTKTEKHLIYKRIYTKTEKYRAKRRIRTNQRRKNDFRFRLDANMCNAIRDALSGRKRGHKWCLLVGYTLQDLIVHLESNFDRFMTWNNYGSYWHVDHIIPRSFFKYKNTEDSEFKKCWALSNLQPLEAKENIRKSNKIFPTLTNN